MSGEEIVVQEINEQRKKEKEVDGGSFVSGR